MNNLKNRSENSKLYTGIFILVVGILLFAKKMNIGLPWWVFSWQMLLIGIGIFNGFKYNFKNPAWFILIIIGSLFLWDEMTVGTNLRPFIFPIILIAVGISFIFSPKISRKKWNNIDSESIVRSNTSTTSFEEGVDSVAIFSGIKKNILSKNFQGGSLVSIMGGNDLNLMQADIQGKVIIEAVNIMGGTKLIVPANWDVQSDELVSIFGGIDDKRAVQADAISQEKVIILKGVNVFGGIEIRSY